ncbi:MAG: helix-turn-helix domain-containing protein [Planctomycetes bacterium]|nr:helix-turn-helix domain-containing protein [Planctomycetota bacterium]
MSQRERVMDDVPTTIKLELTPLVLTRGQVATLLQVPEDTIENLHRTKQLPGFLVGKHLRWRLDDVRGFAETLARDGRSG